MAIIVCFLMCFPIVYTNILAGLDSMGDELKEMACVYKLTDVQKVRYIYGPSVKPQINSALRLICGLSADSDGVYTCRSCIEYRN